MTLDIKCPRAKMNNFTAELNIIIEQKCKNKRLSFLELLKLYLIPSIYFLNPFRYYWAAGAYHNYCCQFITGQLLLTIMAITNMLPHLFFRGMAPTVLANISMHLWHKTREFT